MRHSEPNQPDTQTSAQKSCCQQCLEITFGCPLLIQGRVAVHVHGHKKKCQWCSTRATSTDYAQTFFQQCDRLVMDRCQNETMVSDRRTFVLLGETGRTMVLFCQLEAARYVILHNNLPEAKTKLVVGTDPLSRNNNNSEGSEDRDNFNSTVRARIEAIHIDRSFCAPEDTAENQSDSLLIDSSYWRTTSHDIQLHETRRNKP